MLNAEVPLIDTRNLGKQALTRDRDGQWQPRKAAPGWGWTALLLRVESVAGAVSPAGDHFRRQLEGTIPTHQGDVTQGEVVVEDPKPSADGRGPLAPRIPGKAYAGLEQVVIRREDRRRQTGLHSVEAQLLVDGTDVLGRYLL